MDGNLANTQYFVRRLNRQLSRSAAREGDPPTRDLRGCRQVE